MPTDSAAETAPLLTLAHMAQGRRLRRALGLADWLVEPLLGLRAYSRGYRGLRPEAEAGAHFFRQSLDILRVSYQVAEDDWARIPAEGPVIVISNHPFGGLDGLIMGDLLLRARPQMRLLVNFLLGRVPMLDPFLIKVDPFGGREAARVNAQGVKEALRWLQAGGLMATWPAGTVSHYQPRLRQVQDPPWSSNVARIIRRSRATVVPVYFAGRNSLLFQALGLVHPRLRTALLAREVLNKRGERIDVRIGHPLGATRLAKFTSDQSLTDFLRLKTYILQNREVADKTTFSFPRWRLNAGPQAPLPPPEEPETLARELALLPAEQCLARQGTFEVYCAHARQIPRLLRELGRLRELTFRAEGEGTGQGRDLDAFDAHYLHLFLWDGAQRQLAGGYRLGLTDRILPGQGRSGLYTTTLFRYKPGVLEGLNPAIELGRSFITAEYQRKPLSLGLLWQGIGRFIAQHPHYRILFGPVSISRDYQRLSKNLMVRYLRQHSRNAELAGQVRAKRPPRSRYLGRLDAHSFSTAVRDIEDVSALISEIEKGDKGVPVLLRHYLKLNATVLSFNVDPEFNDCIDGLILVDLTKTPERTLRRYMGEDGARTFYDYHGIEAPVTTAAPAAAT